jgi:hypothetical protein
MKTRFPFTIYDLRFTSGSRFQGPCRSCGLGFDAAGRKAHWCFVLLALLFGIAPALFAAVPSDDFTFVYRNGDEEWAATGDFNHDSFLDVVVVSRSTGVYRIGYQTAGGDYQWVAPRASGISDVSGFSVGTLHAADTHSFAFTAEAANRVNVVSASDITQAGVPTAVYLPSVGPNQVLAINVGGPGDTPLQDLVVASAWNGVAAFRTTTIRNADGASFSTILDSGAAQRWERGNRVIIKQGLPSPLAVLARGLTDTLQVISYAGGPINTFLSIPNLPSQCDYAAGRFKTDGLGHFLVYRPGQAALSAYPVQEPVPGSFAIGSVIPLLFESPIQSVITLPGTPTAKLLVIFDGGTHAAAYNFDGTNAPVLLQEFLPESGERLLGASPRPGHGLHLHSGTATGSSTTHSRRYSFDAGTGAFTLQHVDEPPRVTDLTGRANVFQFQFEPFVNVRPRLLHSGNSGDWSSIFSLAAGQVGVFNEQYVDATHGLDNPTATSLGASQPSTQFGLVNQYASSVSLFSLGAGPGPEVTEVTATPPGGLFARSAAVRLTTGGPGFQILYRLNAAGAWQNYVAGQEITIFTNTVLQFRARAIFGTAQTAIHSETYKFKEGPSTLDSDGDGVPDFAEVAHGLDPKSGSDADGDGASDLEELLKNTSPSDPSSHPVQSGFEQHATFNLVITPRPWDGTLNTDTTSRTGTVVRLYNLSGSMLASSTVGQDPAVPLKASVVFSNVFVDPRDKLLVVATEPHFDVNTPVADTRIGRELVSLLAAPDIAPINVDYTFGAAGGALPAEAANWVAAATAAHQAEKPQEYFTLTMKPVFVTCLLEERLQQILAGTSIAETNVTLFQFRTADAGRGRYGDEARDALEHADPTRPAYQLQRMFHAASAIVSNPPNAQVASLETLVQEVYRISSASNNAAPGQYPLPLDVVRGFLRTGTIHPNYAATGSFPPALLADAMAGAQFVMSQLNERPVTNMTLRIRPDTFGGTCTTVETADLSATPVNLFEAGGGRYDFPEAFRLLPGSVVEVVGRPDFPSTTCAGINLEVLGISLAVIPTRSDSDADGNLLIDTWEDALLGGQGDPFGDDDGDGYSNLQEMFEGTDPNDALALPKVPIAPVKWPALEIGAAPAGEIVLEWFWPETYQHKVQFQIASTADLNLPLTTLNVVPENLGNGNFRVVLTPDRNGSRFFRALMLLR